MPKTPTTGHPAIADPVEEAFASELEAFMAAGRAAVAVPALPESSLSAAVLARDGWFVWQDARFASLIDPDQNDLIDARKALAGQPVTVHHGRNVRGGAVCLVVGTPEATAQWPIKLPPDALQQAGAGAMVAVAVALGHEDDALQEAGRAFGLSPQEARISATLVRTGSLKVAAKQCGIAYDTAREAAENARRKAGVARQPQLVARLVTLVGQTYDTGREADRVLVDTFGLSPREAALALAMMHTGQRQQAAHQVGVSDAVAKKMLSRVYELLGIQSASDLSRTVLDVVAGALLAGAAERDLPLSTNPREPLRLLQRRTGGQIAYSDYGPAKGRPLIVTHSGSASRLIPRSLVAKLQARGWRPIAIDRPGFGLSDLRTNQADPWMAACEDMVELLDGLKIKAIDFLVRGGVYAVVALARIYPQRVGKVVALCPDVSTFDSHKRDGALGMLWKLGESRPDAYADVTRWLASHTTPNRLSALQRVLLRRSPMDIAALSSPQEQEDFRRSVGLFAAGRVEGTIAEHREHSRGVQFEGLTDGRNWHVMLGAQDPLHACDDMKRFWLPRLPGATFTTVDPGGRFLHLTHPDLVLGALEAAVG